MKSRALIIVTALIGFSAGALAVRQFFPGGTGNSADAAPVATRKNRSGGDRENGPIASKGTVSTSAGKHDFATLVRNSPQLLAKLSPLGRELERMDVGELKSLLLETAASLKLDTPPEDKQAASSVLYAAAAEVYRREGIHALDWAAEIPKENGRGTVLSAVLSPVTRDLPETGKEWVEKYRAELGDEWARGFSHQAIVGANGRGAEDMLKVVELFKNDLRGISLTQGTYAEDFDFHRLITGQPAGFDFSEAVTYWAARDKEAAWGAVDEVIKSGGIRGTTYFGSLFRGIVTLEGDEKAAAWTAGKLAEIPAESREKAIRSLVMYRLPGETVSKLVRAMPDENDRVSFVAEISQSYRGESAMEALRALDSENLQTRALVRSAGKYAGYAAHGNPPSKETREFFNTTMEKLNFTPAARQRVEAAFVPPEKVPDEGE
jgi:hypothetical protein